VILAGYLFGRSRRTWEVNIGIYIKEMGYVERKWVVLKGNG
jgi:hypothetical protein